MARKKVLESLEFEIVGNKEKKPWRNHGERIREIREQCGLTQEKMTEKLGIETKTLSKVENGVGILSGEAAIKLYLEYGYSLDWIYGVTDVQDEKSPYLVDVRDLICVDNGVVHIKLKKYIYDLLKNLNDEIVTASLQELAEAGDSFFKGIAVQRRRFVYFNNDSEYYCANIPIEEFRIKSK